MDEQRPRRGAARAAAARFRYAVAAVVILVALGLSAVALGPAHVSPLPVARTIMLPTPLPAATFASIGGPAVVWQQAGLATGEGGARAYIAAGLFPGGQAADPSVLSVYTIDLRGGRVLARADLSTPVAALIPDPVAGRVLLLQPWAAAIGVIDARGGRLLPPIPLGYHPAALAIDPRGHAYAAGLDNLLRPTFSVVDTRSGHVLRTTLLGAGLPVWLAPDAARNQVFAGLASETRGGGTTMTVLALDARTGRARRIAVLPGPALAALDRRRALLYLVGEQWARILDTRSGRTLHTLALSPLHPLGGSPPGLALGLLGAPAVRLALDPASGRVAVLRPDGLHVALLDSHGVANTLLVRGGVTARTAGGGHVIAGTGAGGALIFDTRDGSADGTIALPGWTGAALVGGRTLLFSSAAASVMPPDPWAWLPTGLRQRLPGVPPPPIALPVGGRLSVVVLPVP